MTIPRQLSLGEVIGQKKGKTQPKPRPVSPGRPRREVDVELLRELRGSVLESGNYIGNRGLRWPEIQKTNTLAIAGTKEDSPGSNTMGL